MTAMIEELVEQKRLTNGMVLSVYDRSRKVAGDRFFVKIECEIALPVHAGFFDKRNENDPELFEEIKQKIGETILFSIPKERNFVAEPDKDSIVSEFIGQVSSNMLTYLDNSVFAQKLFEHRYEEIKKAVLAERCDNRKDEPEEDDGPADFSACFID